MGAAGYRKSMLPMLPKFVIWTIDNTLGLSVHTINFSDNSWTQRIEIHHPPTSLHADSRTRNEVKKSEDETIFDASRRELVNFRRAKTDLSEYDLGPRRSRLPIFVSNENARVWLDLNNKKSNR